MITSRTTFRVPAASGRMATQAFKSFSMRSSFIATQRHLSVLEKPSIFDQPTPRRFSTTEKKDEFFEKPKTNKVYTQVPAAWAHPIYNEEQMNAVVVAHREARTTSDRLAYAAVKVLRTGLDFATGYRHERALDLNAKDPEAARKKYAMTEEKYMIRNVFLESVAGVPGMVAGMIRHLNSMRRLKRDNGWIETLIEESFNERMHLLTFLKLSNPGFFMRFFVLGAQGVMCNALFFTYLLSPRFVHRFVGYLEEEAVITYTRQIKDLDEGRLPKWEKLQAPDIAVEYWKMPEGKRSMRDLLLYIRSDESKHREVNHTLGNLDQKNDPNPYAAVYKDNTKPHPTKGLLHQKPTGWERSEII